MVYSAKSDSAGTISQFTRKRPFVVSHSGALTAYQKMVTVAYEPGMLSNFGDIRFVTKDGTHIPYWVESQTDGVSADVWFKADFVDGDTTVLMYYGNDGLTSESSIKRTGLTGSDEFLGTSIDLDIWNGETARTTVSNGVMTFVHASGDVDWLYTDIANAQPFIMEANVQMPSSGDDMTFGLSNGATNTRVAYLYKATDVNRFYTSDGTSSYVITNAVYGSYGVIKIVYTAGSVGFFQDDVELTNSPKTNNVPTDNLNVVIRNPSATDDYLFKWVLIRQYTATEPTSVWGEPQHQRRHPQFM